MEKLNDDYSTYCSTKELIKEIKKGDESPNFYQHYPRLFKEYFNVPSEDVVTNLSEAGYIYYLSIILTDLLIDNNNISFLPKIMVLQEEAVKILTTIYGANSEFWSFWNKRREEYFEAIKIERLIIKQDEVSISIYTDLADKKSAFGKVAIDCLYLLSNKNDNLKYSALLKSHKYFSIGLQLYDDVNDFREDLEIGQFNWAINQLKREIDFLEYKNNYDTLNKLLFIKGVGQEILILAIKNFKKALKIVKSLGLKSEWFDTIKKTMLTVEETLDITIGYIKTIEKRIALKEKKLPKKQFFNFSSIENLVIKKGLGYIKNDFLNNYFNLKHIMYLSKKEGFKNTKQIHVSDTFQRAVLNDHLFDISKTYNLDISDFLGNECQYLINRRNKDNVGGWSYFPTVKEIAADIDDLGQIIQLFIKTNNHVLIDKFCMKPIEICLSNRICLNGGIETWIIPRRNQTATQQKQEIFNKDKWGKGPDLEVVANFIYALQIFNQDLYKEQIENALKYIANNQNENGFWESRWYYGNHYGTYICLRTLKFYKNKYSNNIQTALTFITNSQNFDGGFGVSIGLNSDALSTSLAILSLKLFFQKKNSSIKKAENYLISIQNNDGSWEKGDFIKPKVQEPYSSKTITTAFVLKSLC